MIDTGLRVLLAVSLALFSVAGAAVNLPDFAALVAQHGPSVVNISTSTAPPVARESESREDDPMSELFKRFIPRLPETPRFEGENKSLGSGFIISSDGYILTNAHVIEDAEEIFVRLVDKREFKATLIGTDSRSDVAVIRIDAQDLPAVALGKPDALKVGEWVVAIGSPFGFDHSVTAGIVSAKGRSLPDENFVPFIQTDVAINPGNSGGPLFNLQGEVVGINSQIYSQTGGFMGLSFAIPIDLALDIQAQLLSDGVVRRGRIGVMIQELTRTMAESFGLPRAEGALVSGLEPDGPAARAGVLQGDVIMSFNGQRVDQSSDLPRIVAASKPQTVASMEVLRDGAPLRLEVTLGEWQDQREPELQQPPAQRVEGANQLGLVLRKPESERSQEQGLNRGLLVESIAPPANRTDLRPGDLVLAIVHDGRHTQLDSVEAFESLVSGLRSGQSVSLLVNRGDGQSYVSFRAGTE